MKYKVLTIIGLLLSSLLSQAGAQSIPLLTDPIKVREVELMSNRLDMTLAQQDALLVVYDTYLEHFGRVRNGEIKDFEDDIAEAAETFGFMNFQIPEREMIENLIRKAERAIRAIQQSDKLFFEEVSGMLTEKQRIELGRIHIARELEAYQLFIVEMLGGLNNGARSHLRTMVYKLDVEATVELDELLDTYDQRYLREVKEGFDTVVQTVRLGLDQIDELNVRGMDQQALMMRFMADPNAIEDLKKRGEILLKPLVDQAYELSQLNWKTWNRLDAMLDEENARELQEGYFGKSFRDSVRGGKGIENTLLTAIELSSISEGQRIDLKELQKTFRSRWSNMTEKHAEVLERSRQKQTVAMMTGEALSGFEDQLSAYRDSRIDYITKTQSRIDSILGEELAARLKGQANATKVAAISSASPWRSDEAEAHEEIVVIDAGSGEGGSTVVIGESIDVSEMAINSDSNPSESEEKQKLYGNATIPKPIPPSFPERAAVVLQLDDTGVIIIEAVYNEYREKYDDAYQAIATGSKDIYDDASFSRGERLRKVNAISKTAADTVATLDTGLFDDIVAVTSLERDDMNVKMLEHHRNRQRSSAPDDPWGWRGGEGDTIDLVGLYVMSKESDSLKEGISEESVQAIQKAMKGYHDQVSGPHKQFVEATYQLAHLEDAGALLQDNENGSDMTESIRRRWRDAFINVRDAKRALLLANQSVMETLLKNVPESDFWKVRMEFVQKAYPDVFKKGSDITTMLTAARAIPSLDVTQQSTLETLSSQYRYDYWNLCEAMIENHQSNATAASSEGFMGKEDVHRQLQLETLRFQRRELNDRMQMRLRMVLLEDQIKDVPGLRPTVATGKEWNW